MLLAGALQLIVAQPALAATPLVRVVSSLETIQPLDSPTGGTAASLTALRGETESFQIAVSGPAGQALTGVDTVLSTPLALPGGQQLPGTATTISLEAYTRIWTPSDQEGLDPDPSLPARQRGWCRFFQAQPLGDAGTCGIPVSYRNPPGDDTPFNSQWKCGGAVAPVVDARQCLVPDALIPRVDPFFGQKRNAFPFGVPSGENRVVWVDIVVPPDATAGTYTGSMTVSATGMTPIDVPIAVTVKPVRMPAAGEAPALDLEAGVRAGTDRGGPFCDAQGCGATTDTAYRQQSLFLRSSLENRLPLTNLPSRAAPYAGANRTAFDKWITPYLTGNGPSATVDGVLPARLPAARSRTVLLDLFADRGDWKAWAETLKASSTSPALRMYCDEVLANAGRFASDCSTPYDDNAAKGWVDAGLAGAPRSFLVGNQAQFNLASARGTAVTANADTLVPNTAYHLQPRNQANTRPSYDAGFLAGGTGRRLWGYDSNNAFGGPSDTNVANGAPADWSMLDAYNGYPAIGAADQPATSERAAGFVAWSYRLSGHFYYSSMHSFPYAWNSCAATPATCLYDTYGGHGDGTLFYPGPTSRVGGTDPIPIESMRLKRFRDGSEDYTLLRLLETGCAGFGGCTARTRAALLAVVGGPDQAEATGAISRTWRTSIGATAYGAARAALMAMVPDPDPPAPTGGRIAFSSTRQGGDRDIWVMGDNGADQVNLTPLAAGYDGQPSWSPDGTRLAFTSDRAGAKDIWVMDADGTDAQNLTATIATPVEKPAWSPDGNRLAFVNRVSGTDQVWVMRADGSRPAFEQNGFDPAWRPDGNELAHGVYGGATGFDLRRAGRAGASPLVVVAGDDDLPDWWGPPLDGNPANTPRLAFDRAGGAGNAAYDIVVADGTTTTVLTGTGPGAAAQDTAPTWSPDGEAIAFVSDRAGAADIWRMGSDGSTPVPLTADAAVDADPDWAMDPSGTPANDTWYGRLDLSWMPSTARSTPDSPTASVTVGGDTTHATTTLDDEHASPFRSVWYSFTAPSAGTYLFSATGAGFTATVDLRDSIPPDPAIGTRVAPGSVRLAMTQGQSVTVTVDGQAAAGPFTLTAARQADPPYRPFASWDQFVARQLTDFAGSPGTVASRAAAVAQLGDGSVTPAAYIEARMAGPWFAPHLAPVARLYWAYFGRIPDHGGLTYWAGRHRAGTGLDTVSQSFASSREFKDTYGALSDAAFVTLVYRNVLGRQPDAAGLSYWVGRLGAGTTRGKVMIGFSESAEHRSAMSARVQVVLAHTGLLGRSPTAAELTSGTAVPITTLIESLRLGAAYAARVT